MLSIRHATLADARALSEFARRTFSDTFAGQNTAEDMAAYLDHAFSEARQRDELVDPDAVTLLEVIESTLVGYAQVKAHEAPACVLGPKPVELVRFYVDHTWHGKGIAQTLMAEVERVAASCGGTLWLGVWERNARAIAFYQKCGFSDAGGHIFQLGSDAQTDRIMVRPLRK